MNSKLIAWLAFAAVAFFWGTTYLAIRIGVETFPPFLLAGARNSIGGILICSYFLFNGTKLPDPKSLRVYAINGFLMLVIGNGLVTWSEMYVNSGLAALICSLTPIWIVLINSFTGSKEKITQKVIIGFMICLAGQLLIFSDNLSDFSNPNYLLGIIFLVIANIGWAAGSVYSKNHKSESPALLGAGIQMLFAGIVLDLIGTIKGEWTGFSPSHEAIGALVYLIIFGSVIAYCAYIYVLKILPATIVSTYAYINTIVAVALGWFLLNEPLNLNIWIAVAMTIGGVWLVNTGFGKKESAK